MASHLEVVTKADDLYDHLKAIGETFTILEVQSWVAQNPELIGVPAVELIDIFVMDTYEGDDNGTTTT